jgi:hypothetical protein
MNQRMFIIFILIIFLNLYLINAADTCSLVTNNTKVFPIPSVPRPTYLVPMKDLTFNTTIIRITNNTGSSTSPVSGTFGGISRHHYSKDQPWNADQSMIFIEDNRASPWKLILNATTYKPLAGVCASYTGQNDFRWNPNKSHSNETINVHSDGHSVFWYDVKACKVTKTITLPSNFVADNMGPLEGNPSNDGRFLALTNDTDMLVVDMENSIVGPTVNIGNCGLSTGCSIDWVSISPSGKYAVVSYNGDYPRVFNVNSTTLILTQRSMPSNSPECSISGYNYSKGYIYGLGHADMSFNPYDNNEEYLVGQAGRSNCPMTINGKFMGMVAMVRLKDNNVTSLTNPSNEAYPYHISTRNIDNPGWAFVSYGSENSLQKYNDEIIEVKMDGSNKVVRLAHSHNNLVGCYLCEHHPVPSRDGKKVIFASAWSINCTGSCGNQSDVKDFLIDTSCNYTSQQEQTCFDTDSNNSYPTINYTTKGNAKSTLQNLTDSCSGSSLTEYYCPAFNSTSVSSLVYSCLYGCSNGACVAQPAPTCSEVPSMPGCHNSDDVPILVPISRRRSPASTILWIDGILIALLLISIAYSTIKLNKIKNKKHKKQIKRL